MLVVAYTDQVQRIGEEQVHYRNAYSHTHLLNDPSHVQLPQSTSMADFSNFVTVCFEICPTDDTQEVKTVPVPEVGPALPMEPVFPHLTGM